MKLTNVNRMVLSGLLALSVAGGSLAPVVAGHAAAGGPRIPVCEPWECPWPEAVAQSGSAADGGMSGGVLRDGAKLGIASGSNMTDGGMSGGVLREGTI